jgi:hypothetical protein
MNPYQTERNSDGRPLTSNQSDPLPNYHRLIHPARHYPGVLVIRGCGGAPTSQLSPVRTTRCPRRKSSQRGTMATTPFFSSSGHSFLPLVRLISFLSFRSYLTDLCPAVAARFGIGRDFWINLPLTLAGYIPGR